MKNSKLIFNSEKHKYTYERRTLMSVTKYISSKFPEFNGEAISPYTAKACSNEIKQWDKEQDLLEECFPKCIKLFGDSWKDEVHERKMRKTQKVTAKEVLTLWEHKGHVAREEGTRVHELIEQALLKNIDFIEYIDEPYVVAAVNYVDRARNLLGYGSSLHPELRIVGAREGGAVEIPLAGTIDLVIDSGEGVWLVDWKTNDDIHKDGYNKGNTEATANITDSALTKYTIQLSLYAYLLEKFYDKKIDKLVIGWLNDNVVKPITVDYNKDLVEEMLREDGYI